MKYLIMFDTGVMHQVQNITQTMSQPVASIPTPLVDTNVPFSSSATAKSSHVIGASPICLMMGSSGAIPGASSSAHSLVSVDSLDHRDTPDSSSSTSLLTGASPQVDESGSPHMYIYNYYFHFSYVF